MDTLNQWYPAFALSFDLPVLCSIWCSLVVVVVIGVNVVIGVGVVVGGSGVSGGGIHVAVDMALFWFIWPSMTIVARSGPLLG
ncbi:hypothetical protein Tco_0833625 [Tanacetum coccineum]